jgi:predicted MPP superfamily phosphohydrolase
MLRFLPFFVPSLLYLLLRRTFFRAPAWQPAWTWLGGVTILTAALDWGLLVLLPALGLSYGPIAPAGALLNAGRMALLVWLTIPLILTRQPARRLLQAKAGAAIQVFLLGLAVYGLYIEPFRLGTTHLSLSNAPALLPDRPLRILHLTDIHVERITRREAEMLEQAAATSPDLILLTGDYVNVDYLTDPLAIAQARQILSQLEAPLGVYAIAGSTDPPWLMQTLFDGLDNIRVLDNESARLDLPGGSLTLIGLTMSGDTDLDRQTLRRLGNALLPSDYTILLYHTPDVIETASALGIDLYLAGHTHGGQIRLPFYGALVTFSEYGKRYEMGEYRGSGTTLYVSRGIGMEGLNLPRLRFLCPPEITLFALTP